MTVNSNPHALIIDAHVHIYDRSNISAMLDAGYSNISSEAQRRGVRDSFTGILMLTETAVDNYYDMLAHSSADKGKENDGQYIEQWEFSCFPDDNGALLASRKTGEELIIIAGRQIATEEGMEVLALATVEQFKDGQPLHQVVEQVRRVGGIPVIPWAVGKWLGRRGRVLKTIIKNERSTGLLLGDNGGRPVFWRNPTHFKLARESGMKIIPGSDPLPLPAEIFRVGSYGFVLHSKISDSQPAHDLRRLLLNPSAKVYPYGNLQRTSLFIRNQLGIRIQK